MEKIIILAYHGTSDWNLDSDDKNIFYKKISEKFPEFKIVETFNAGYVVKKIRESGGRISTALEILDEIPIQKSSEIFIVPMYLIEGVLWRGLREKIIKKNNGLEKNQILAPILGELENFPKLVEIFKKKFNNREKAYLLAAHGGEDIGNSALGMLGYLLSLERDNFFMATLENGIPLDKVIKKISEKKYREVEVIPLFMQKGIHFQRDIDEKIVKKLEKHDIIVEIYEKIITDYEEIGELFVEKLSSKITM